MSYYETDSVIGKVISEAEFGGDTKDIGLLSDWTIIDSNDSYGDSNNESKLDHGLDNYYKDWSSVFFSGDSSKYEQYP